MPSVAPALPLVHLSEIAALDNIWINGPKGSGKTTLLRTLIALRPGRHIVFDPYAAPGKWGIATVIGAGRDFRAIDRVLTMLSQDAPTERLTIVGDEWPAIYDNLPDMPRRMHHIISKGREIGIWVLAASETSPLEWTVDTHIDQPLVPHFNAVIYLGELAMQHRPETMTAERPALVFYPNSNTWAQLATGE